MLGDIRTIHQKGIAPSIPKDPIDSATTHYPQNCPLENSKCRETQTCNTPKIYCNCLKIKKRSKVIQIPLCN